MSVQKVRNLLVVGLLAVMLVVGNVIPVAAQTFTPVPIGCSFHGKSYPLGTVLHFVLPEPEPMDVYMRCEFNLSPNPTAPKTHWVIYSSDPS